MGKKRGNYYFYGYGGVYLRRGKKLTRYYIDYHEGTVRRRVMVKNALSVEDALRELQKRVRSLNGGAKYSTFQEYSVRYMDTHAKAKRSFRDDKSRMEPLREFFGARDLRDIEPSDVEAFRQARLKLGNSKSTSNRYLALVSRLFNLAVQDGYMEKNPARYIKKFSEKETKVERILSRAEDEKLMDACPPHVRDMVFLALHTGMREGEIKSLRVDCVDFKTREIRVEYAKSGKYRHVPMDSAVSLMLSSLATTKQVYIFENNRTHKRYVNVYQMFCKSRKKAGLHGVRFHDLRHTFATRLADAGAPPSVIQMILGHSDLRITQRYVHPDKDSALEAVEKLNDSPTSSHVAVTNPYDDAPKSGAIN
jgi:integrase